MRKLLILLMAASSIMSCSKDEVTCLKEEFIPKICIDDICIDGEWDWIESSGSIAGVTISPDTEMTSRKLIITETNYQEFVGGELVLDTAHEFVKSDEFTDDGVVLKLLSGNGISIFSIFEDDERLILLEPCNDCWRHTYKRR